MRKRLLGTFLTIVLIVTSMTLAGCSSKDNNSTLQKIKLNEVVRSVFYAPMYVALNEGFFKEEGLNIELSTGQGADSTIFKTQVF